MSAFSYPGNHHVWLRYSSNGGTSWSALRQLDSAGDAVGIWDPFPVPDVGNDGRVYIAFTSKPNALQPARMMCVSSTNRGVTLQRSMVDANLNLDFTNNYKPFQCISSNPVQTGNVIIAWPDRRLGDLDILLSRSTNSGANWSAPVRINDDNSGKAQDMVWASFSPNGFLALSWKDRRFSSGSSNIFDIFSCASTNGGATFFPNYRMSTVSSPDSQVAAANEYTCTAITNSIINIVWADHLV